MNSCCDTDDVSRPYSGRQSRTQSLKAVNVTVTAVFGGKDQFQGTRQPEELNKTQANRQYDPRPDKKEQQGRPPNKTVYGIQHVYIHFKSTPFFLK